MNIRFAKKTDAECISRMMAASYVKAYQGKLSDQFLNTIAEDRWVSFILEQLDTGNMKIAVAEEDSVWGCIIFGKAREQDKEAYGEVVALYVHPACWRKKIGERLLQFAHETLMGIGYKKCLIWVLKENQQAINFYLKHSYAYDHKEMTVEMDGEVWMVNCYTAMLI